ncbi:MAG: tRNA dihydrouridine synthase [Butyricicoccus sp.]
MTYYFAPLEGITGYIYRNTYQEFFGGIQRYFTPFLAPNQDGGVRTRDKNDVLPEHNVGISVVPQILTNNADAFLTVARWLADLGYTEINLNLGCPSGTVVAKKKGSGLLAETALLEQLLDAIFRACPTRLSIKTRIGKQSPEEFPALLELFNRYPMTELIIHPRVQKEYYKGHPHWESFAYAVEHANMPLCYNGDLFRVRDIQDVTERFPSVDRLMLGRGLLSDPGLLCKAEGRPAPEKQVLYDFHQTLLRRYQEVMSSDRNVLFHMKELWACLSCLFTEPDKHAKKIRKAQTLRAYQAAVDDLFARQELREESSFHG